MGGCIFRSVCVRMCRNEQGNSKFRGECKLTTFLFTVTRHVITRISRKENNPVTMIHSEYSKEDNHSFEDIENLANQWFDDYPLDYINDNLPHQLKSYVNLLEDHWQDPEEVISYYQTVDNINKLFGKYNSYSGSGNKVSILEDRIGGMSYKGLADKYDMPLGTIKSSLHFFKSSMLNDLRGKWR